MAERDNPFSVKTILWLIAAGINDWGGVSPVTPDHVNPEAPWPAITELAQLDPSGKEQLRVSRQRPG